MIQLEQAKAAEIVIPVGATGITPGNLTVEVWKPGMGGYGNTSNGAADTELTDTGSNPTGDYRFPAEAVDLDTLGHTRFRAYDGQGNVGTLDVTVVPQRDSLRQSRTRPGGKARTAVLTLIALTAILVTTAHAFLNTYVPEAGIEYTPGPHDPATGQYQDIQTGDAGRWLDAGTSSIGSIQGYAHAGGIDQTEANNNVDAIQIWGWHDQDGDGQADADDARHGTTTWTKLTEIDPGTNGASVVGWPGGNDQGHDGWGDVLQDASGGDPIPIGSGESWLLLIRVVDSTGATSTFDANPGTAQWDNGDTSDNIGSDVPSDKYLDAQGNTPGTTDGRIDDDEVLWIYRPR